VAEWQKFQHNEDCVCPPETEQYLDDDLGVIKQALIAAGCLFLVLALPLGFLFMGAVALLIVGFTVLYRTMDVEWKCVKCRRKTKPKSEADRLSLVLTRKRYFAGSGGAIMVGALLFLVKANTMVKPPEVPGIDTPRPTPAQALEQMQQAQEEMRRRAQHAPPPPVAYQPPASE
jgi:hypothetical protein